MPKLRMTMTIVREYEADPAAYGETDPETMAAMDRSAYMDDPALALDGESTIIVTVEVVE